MTRYTTTGNNRPWVVQDGYRNAPRVNGPLERTPPLTRRERAQLAIVMLKAGAYTVALFAVAAIALAAVGG